MRFLPQEVIRKKRDNEPVATEEIKRFVAGMVDGTVGEGQVAAFAMAVYFNSMTRDECVALTLAMRESGRVLDWPGAAGPVLDKHSTGGVGDNVSLILAPLVAACGGVVPMISGRGLGHTGGTLDKMDSIPGYQSQPDETRFRRAVAAAGCAIIGQTGDLAPADRRFYAIRDVTATVESVPLITASILSKKLAAGLDALVLDVKSGSGAFVRRPEAAAELAASLVEVADGAGLKTGVLITDMNQPLASAAGNAVEAQNAVDFLTGAHRDMRLHEVVLALAAEMLILGDLAETREAAWARLSTALENGAAAERFQAMVSALGGPNDFLDDAPNLLPAAAVVRPVEPPWPGTVSAIDTWAVGMAVIGLGGGRTRPQDDIDHAVGFSRLAAIGDEVGPDRPLALVHARTDADAKEATDALLAAYRLGDGAAVGQVVLRRIE